MTAIGWLSFLDELVVKDDEIIEMTVEDKIVKLIISLSRSSTMNSIMLITPLLSSDVF